MELLIQNLTIVNIISTESNISAEQAGGLAGGLTFLNMPVSVHLYCKSCDSQAKAKGFKLCFVNRRSSVRSKAEELYVLSSGGANIYLEHDHAHALGNRSEQARRAASPNEVLSGLKIILRANGGPYSPSSFFCVS